MRATVYIVDEVLFPERFDVALEFRPRCLRKFGNGLDVDVERIEEMPAVGKIRAGLLGPVVEQGMQRIESDRRGAVRGGDVDQVCEVREITVAPVAARADAVELHGDRP